ncbi:MAG: hypothetical protein FD165_669 [Gammaproteobacteria bacterium]|nr:MAG: hypothetical protein FD165_669 [Gammaproteobacteria bacterium]TND06996.1 MAG: hypothetical protein FD120_164 [Gammaproteobacteria bacterium]
MSHHPTRRTLLKVFAAIVVQGLSWAAVPASAYARVRDLSAVDPLEHTLRTLFPDKDTASAMARRYREHYPAMAANALPNVRRLLAPYFGEPTLIAGAIKQQRSIDFAQGNSVIINGWVVARCEADLCSAALQFLDV